MLVLAFDLGATFGWALGNSTKASSMGEYYCGGDRPARLGEFMDYAGRLIERKAPGFIVYERPFARGEAATRSLWGMAGVLEAVANRAKIAVVDAAPPMTIKKHWTGNHRASKDEMILAAQTRGYDIKSEHIADALATLDYTIVNLVGE